MSTRSIGGSVRALVPIVAVLVALAVTTGARAAIEREPTVEVLYERGAHALRLGDSAEAIDQLGRASEAAPDDTEVLGLYARALLLGGRPVDAGAVLERLRALDPHAEDLDLMEGLTAFRTRDWETARLRLEAVREIDPRNARARLFLAIAYTELGDHDSASREFEEAVTLDPSLQGHAAYRQGLAAAAADRTDEARKLFEEVVSQAPGTRLARSASAQLRLLGAHRPWNAYGVAGFAYDTNANLGGGEGDVFREISGETDYLGLLEAGADGAVLSSERGELRLGYRGVLTAHRNEKDLDIAGNRGWVQTTYFVNDWLSAETRYHLDWAWADYDSFRRTHRVAPALRIAPHRSVMLRAFYEWEDRDFFGDHQTFRDERDNRLDRDGTVALPGADLYWMLPAELGVEGSVLRLGGRFRREETSGAEFDSRGPVWVATLMVPLPGDTRLAVEGWYERRRFKNASVFRDSVGNRSDRVSQLRITVERPLSDRLWVEGGYRFVHWSSNVDFYDFDRHVSDVRLGYRF